MKYFITEELPNGTGKKTARVKARADVEAILESAGFLPVQTGGTSRPKASWFIRHLDISRRWAVALRFLTRGDVLVIQFPVRNGLFLPVLMRSLATRGVVTILIAHDLDILRKAKRSGTPLKEKLRRHVEEVWLLKTSGAVIIHNRPRTGSIPLRRAAGTDTRISFFPNSPR